MTGFWRIRVDWNQDGDFTDSIDDISDDFIEATWHLGMREPFQLTADEADAEIIVSNANGKYSSENALSPLYGYLKPHRRIELTALSGAGVVMYSGWLEEIRIDWEPAEKQTGQLRATLVCTGIKSILQDAPVTLDLYTNETGDTIIEDTLDSAGIVDYSTETGKTTLPFFGDLSSGRSAWDIIAEITGTERGRFFEARNGEATWWHRHHFLTPDAATGLVDSSSGAYRPKGIDYGYGRHLFNQIRVEVSQRTISGSSVTLWTLEEAIYIPAGETRIVEVALRKSDGQFVATGAATATGATYSTGTATITVATKGGKAEITIANGSTVDAILTALSLEGAPTINQNLLIAESSDASSITEFGKRTMPISITGLASYDEARDVALYELGRLKAPFGNVRSVTFVNSADGAANYHQVAWSIGTRVNLDLPEIDHNRDYFIIGEDHTAAIKIHTTAFYLEPADLRNYWILQDATYGKLESTTRLGY